MYFINDFNNSKRSCKIRLTEKRKTKRRKLEENAENKKCRK